MKLPSKLYSFEESILNNFVTVLSIIKENEDIKTIDLYNKSKNKIADINDFIETLEALYILNKISYDYTTGRINYVS